MTAWVPEPLDATAGRARRRGPWGRAAWRWSLLAGLGLHMAVLASWWVVAQQAEPVVPVQPMQVRLTALASAGAPVLAQRRLPAVTRPAAQAAATASLARSQSDPVRPSPPPPSPRDAAQAPMAPPKPAPVGPAVPAAAPAAPAQPEAAPSPMPVPVPVPMPNPSAQRPAPAPVDGPALASLTKEPQAAATPGQGEGRREPTDEIPSSAIAYVVKPVLTFPPGSEDLGEFGSVTLRVWVDEKGVASTVQRLKSSGFARLDQHAAQVIRRARFKPHIDQGKARAGWATVTLSFNPS